jgi:hypothetical protein
MTYVILDALTPRYSAVSHWLTPAQELRVFKSWSLPPRMTDVNNRRRDYTYDQPHSILRHD